ncbi:hypothetical protein ACQWKP_23305, partial [Salmonella enterica subsp. enterica serovar Infantis]
TMFFFLIWWPGYGRQSPAVFGNLFFASVWWLHSTGGHFGGVCTSVFVWNDRIGVFLFCIWPA